MHGRRIPVADPPVSPTAVLRLPGDYYGPVRGFNGDRPGVFFLLPIADDIPGRPEAKGLHCVCSPPHVFTEEPDGSLTITDSIGCGRSEGYYWHGYLTKGEWSQC